MTECLTCRKIGFMFGCFGFILAHLGRFWVGIAECGAHVGLWVSSWCFDGVSVMSGHCVCGLSPVSWCCGLWVCCVLVRRVVLVVRQSWVYQCLRRCVLVALGRACMRVMLCLRVILMVLRWHLSRTFGGVCAVSCLWVSCWCWHGVFWL